MSIQLRDGGLQVFDVDHGQCALLTLPRAGGGAYRVMIDCGHAVNFNGAPWYPAEHLQSLGIKHIDLLIFTNYDEDHASEFPDLVARGITIGCILGNPSVPPEVIVHLKSETGLGKGIRKVAEVLAARRRAGHVEQVPVIPGLKLSYFWNPYPFFDDENNLSLVANLQIHGWNFLFPGDLEGKGWRNMLTTYPPFAVAAARVHVLMAAHHGRESGRYPELFTAYNCKPRLAVISDDYKQYDTQETTSYYGSKASGIAWFRDGGPRKVLTTRDDKELRFSFSNGGILVW